mmetsp:Transcript_26274/g.30381  ORF Transcript_26274/g.30381 Transcript_26274/m.30381 type:complete len:116 (+) Transcript_26274:256-603(+)
MAFLLLRAIFGPDLVFTKIDVLSNLLGFDFNLRNIATIVGVLGTLNIFSLTFYTAWSKCQPQDKKYLYVYFIYLQLLFAVLTAVLPATDVFKLLPVPCITIVGCSLIKLCWKFII